MLCSTTFGGDGMVEVLVGGRPGAIVSDYDINSTRKSEHDRRSGIAVATRWLQSLQRDRRHQTKCAAVRCSAKNRITSTVHPSVRSTAVSAVASAYRLQ